MNEKDKYFVVDKHNLPLENVFDDSVADHVIDFNNEVSDVGNRRFNCKLDNGVLFVPPLRSFLKRKLIPVWALPLIFLFVFLLPLYPFLIPSHVLEGFVAEKQTNENKSWTDSKWFKPALNLTFVLLMSLASLVILADLSDYWYFFKLVPFLFGLLFFFCISVLASITLENERLLPS